MDTELHEDRENDEREFIVYEHEEDSNCNYPGVTVPNHPSLERDECPFCREPLVKAEEITVSQALPKPRQYIVKKIQESTPQERAIYLAMVTQSIAANYRVVERRLGIIGEICQQGVDDVLSDDLIESTLGTARSLIADDRAIYREYEGDRFRNTEEIFASVGKDVETMREFATFIPNDIYYTTKRFETLMDSSD